MEDGKVNQPPRLARIMAKSCEHCPFCRYARAHPETRFGRMMAWHGTWCPFWKAQKRVSSAEPPA